MHWLYSSAILKKLKTIWLLLFCLCCSQVFAQLPDIVALNEHVCVPQPVYLEIKNCTGCKAYEWKIGNGGYQVGKDQFSTIITTPGVYDVTVLVTTSTNLKYPITKTAAFTVHAAPTVSISYNRQATCNSADTFLFTDNTPNSVSRDWLFENTLINKGPQTATFRFSPYQGYKSVYLLARDSWGCAAGRLYDSFFGIWSVPTVTANASAWNGCNPAKIKFNTNNVLNGQSVRHIDWWFPGASPAYVRDTAPTITFAKKDTFSFMAVLTTSQGCIDTVEYKKKILIGDSVKFSLSTVPTTLCVNQQNRFVVAGNNIERVDWDFIGKGAFKRDTGSLKSVTGSFGDTGWQSVKVTATSHGCSNTITKNRAFRIKGPKAAFDVAVPNYCAVPDTLVLTNKSAEEGTTTWQWIVKDSAGSTFLNSNSRNVTQVVRSLNRYSVTLIAKSTNGCTDTISKKDAMVGGKIDSTFSFSPNPSCPGEYVSFTPKAGPGNARVRHFFQWTFYDNKGKFAGTSTQFNPIWHYTLPGRYSAKLIISNSRKCKDSVFYKDTVKVLSPEVQLSIKDSIVCVNEPFTVYATRIKPVPGYFTYWDAIHLDSSNIRYHLESDTATFKIWAPGRYRMMYAIMDAVTRKCGVYHYLPNLVKVSGPIVRAKVTPPYGCAPLNSTLSTNWIADLNYHSKTVAKSQRWKFVQNVSSIIPNPNLANVNGTFPKGVYNFSLQFTGSSGCADSTGMMQIESGLIAKVQGPGDKLCRGVNVQLYNKSSYWAESITYSSDTAWLKFNPSNTDPNPYIRVNKGGEYPIRLIAKYKTCSDTASTILRIQRAEAAFYSPDTITYCAPQLVQVFNASPGAVQSKWCFSDGDTVYTNGHTILNKIFKKNNPNPGFDITLILRNYLGCYDTLSRKGYFKVIGPVPSVKMNNAQGCEPLKVEFVNTSSDFSSFFIDYGDGTVLDSAGQTKRSYKVTNISLNRQTFKPKIIVGDTLDCFAVAYPDDSVVVLKNAEAGFSFKSSRFLRRTEGCEGDLLVGFRDQSRYSVRNYWDFDGDDTVDIQNQVSPNYLYGKPGIFFPRIIAQNVNGCRDTFIKDSIIVWEKPNPAYYPRQDSICARDTMRFVYSGKSKYSIKFYRWDFGEAETFHDTSNQKNGKWKYTVPFDKTANLTVVDSNGCSRTFFRGVYVLDTAGPKKPEIAWVSVPDDKSVEFRWEKSRLGNYYRYHLYYDSTRLFYNYPVSGRDDTMRNFYKGDLVDTLRYCFTFKIEDTCSQMGRMAVSHCTMILRDSAKELYHMNLSWLSYDGWSTNLSHYEVFRKDQDGTFKLIGLVDNNQTTYVDSFLCDKEYCYYIQAVHKNRKYRSRSNVSCGTPIYKKPDGATNIELVTVVNDSFPYIRWNSNYRFTPGSKFQLERSNSGNPGSFAYALKTTNLSVIDRVAEAKKSAYYYRVVFKDHCDEPGNPGSISNSIFLKGLLESGKLRIDWNKYAYWVSGVKEYKLQVKQKDGVFVDWFKFNPGQTEKTDIDLEGFGLDTVRFRVIAVKDSMPEEYSVSNTVAFIPASYVLLPSAFSPDDNGINEVFKPYLGFVHRNSKNPKWRYEFKIFNRWGQKVYETNNTEEGWNGHFNGQACQTGLYIYEVSAVGYDGVPHRVQGTVYLSR